MKRKICTILITASVFTTSAYVLVNGYNELYKKSISFIDDITTFDSPIYISYNELLSTLDRVNIHNISFDGGIQNYSSKKILINNRVEYCHFLDFTGCNGYVLFDNTNIYAYKLTGDYPYLLDNTVIFSLADGFIKDLNSRYYKIDANTGEIIKDICLDDSFAPTNFFDDRDGELLNSELDSYINEVHPNWTLDYTAQMSNFVELFQYYNSFYFHKYRYYVGTNIFNLQWTSSYSEGNCGPTAIATYLYNLPTLIDVSGYIPNYCPNLLNGQSTLNVDSLFNANSQTRDVFYDDYSNNFYLTNSPDLGDDKTTVGVQFNVATTIPSPTMIYWNVRNRSIYRGLTPDSGLPVSYYGDVVNYVSSLFGYNIEIYNTNVISNVINNISVGVPVIITVNGSKTYGNHAMTIYGYKKYYSYEWFVQVPHYIWLVMDGFRHPINDNYLTWFDPNRTSTTSSYYCTNTNSLS